MTRLLVRQGSVCPSSFRRGREAEVKQSSGKRTQPKTGTTKKPKAGRKRESPRPHEKAGGPEKAKTKKNTKDSRRGTTDFFVR